MSNAIRGTMLGTLHSHAVLWVMALALALAAACSDAGPVPPVSGPLARGTWGGQDAGVIVTDSTTHVHIGCTLGDIPARIQLDALGRFSVSGSYVISAYPIQTGPAFPAQFSGQVRGNSLTFSVSVNDTVQHRTIMLGPATVTFNRTPNMGPCPICAAPRPQRARRTRLASDKRLLGRS